MTRKLYINYFDCAIFGQIFDFWGFFLGRRKPARKLLHANAVFRVIFCVTTVQPLVDKNKCCRTVTWLQGLKTLIRCRRSHEPQAWTLTRRRGIDEFHVD